MSAPLDPPDPPEPTSDVDHDLDAVRVAVIIAFVAMLLAIAALIVAL